MRETQETWVRPLGLEDPLEEGMTTDSSILAIPSSRSRLCWVLYFGFGDGSLIR